MKPVKTLIMLMVLALTLAPATAFPGMTENQTNQTTDLVIDQSQPAMPLGHELVALQHVVEIAQDGEGENSVFGVREAIAMRNVGSENYTGPMNAWVPSNAQVLAVVEVRMHETEQGEMVDYAQEGNTLTWNCTNPIPPNSVIMIVVEYTVPFGHYEKQLKYPTGVAYIKSYTLDVQLSPSDMFTLSESTVEESMKVQTWEWRNPTQSFTIDMSVETDYSSYLSYVGMGLVVIGLLSYPLLRQRFPALKEFESKVVPRKTPESLRAEKEAVLKVLEELERDFEAGDLDEAEYEALRQRYERRAKDIIRRLDEMEGKD